MSSNLYFVSPTDKASRVEELKGTLVRGYDVQDGHLIVVSGAEKGLELRSYIHKGGEWEEQLIYPLGDYKLKAFV